MTSEQKMRGRWKSGESGNPAGRKPGTGKIAKLREGIASNLPDIIAKLVVMAKAGDVQAARLLLERVLPPVKPIELAIALPMPSGKGTTAQGEAILQAVANGTIAPSQGAALLTGLGALARIREIDELERRISQLEEGLHDNI